MIQLGDSGGIETTGYYGSVQQNNITTRNDNSGNASLTRTGAAGHIYHGTAILTLVDSATNTWSIISILGQSDASTLISYSGHTKALSGELTTIRLTTSSGTANFDGGVAGALYSI